MAMDKSLSTASLLMFKAEAKRLHRCALNNCPTALGRLANTAGANLPAPSHTECLKTLAIEYGYDSFQQLVHLERLILKFTQMNIMSGALDRAYGRTWNLKYFDRQYAAIRESAEGGIPLAHVAKSKDVDFRGFEFTSLLYSRLIAELKMLPQFDFSELDACGSYIEDLWAYSVTSFERVKLAHAKFFHISDGGLSVLPGMSVYCGNFTGADLRGADLRSAYLRGSEFFGADLEGADLRGANIFECHFEGARGTFQAGGAYYNRAWIVTSKGRHQV